jgi:biopolymer transport protein TolR
MELQLEGTKRSAMSEINVVPLIDILLVLLIIFLVITPTNSSGLQVLAPRPADSRVEIPTGPVTPVIVQIQQGDNLKINQENATWDTLGPRLEHIFKNRADKTAFVMGDGCVLFAQVARAIDISRGSGVDRIGLITAKLQAGQ